MIYMLFAGSTYYPEGGTEDLVCAFRATDDREATDRAIGVLEEEARDWHYLIALEDTDEGANPAVRVAWDPHVFTEAHLLAGTGAPDSESDRGAAGPDPAGHRLGRRTRDEAVTRPQSIRFPDDLRAAITAEAVRLDRSFSWVAIRRLRESFAGAERAIDAALDRGAIATGDAESYRSLARQSPAESNGLGKGPVKPRPKGGK